MGGFPSSSSLWLRAVVARGLSGLAPSPPCLHNVCVRFWVGGPLTVYLSWRLARVARCRVGGVPFRPLDAHRWRTLLGECSPPSFPPWVDACIKRARPVGGIYSSPPSSCLSHVWSACYPVSASVRVSVCLASAVSLVAPWPSPLVLVPTLARPPSGSSDASKLYLRRECMPFLDLAPSAPTYCCGRVPALSLSAYVPLRHTGTAVLGSRAMPLLPPSASLSSLSQVVGGFPYPPRPCLSSSVTLSPSMSTPGVLSPWGNASAPGVSMPCGNSTPPPTP